MAEKMFHLPIFYMEYSGSYGNPSFVKAAKSQLNETVLFYGGGIETVEQAEEMGRYADVIVVGNVIYKDLSAALHTIEIKKSKRWINNKAKLK